MAPRSPLRRWVRILAIQILVWPLALLLAEGANRVRLRIQGRPYRAEAVRDSLESLSQNARSFVPKTVSHQSDAGTDSGSEAGPAIDRMERVAEPWTGYDMVGGLMTLNRLVKDTYQGRGADQYHVLVVGGSVSQMFANPPAMGGGSDVLARALAADERLGGRPVAVWNFGRGGFKQPQQMNLFLWVLTLGLRPDAVINLDGFNEVALGNTNWEANGTHPGYPSVGHWGHIVQGAPDEESLEIIADVLARRDAMVARCELGLHWQIWRSSLLGPWLSQRLERDKAFCTEGQKRYEARVAKRGQLVTRGPALPGGAPVAEAVRIWKETSRTMREVCQARGIHYVHVLQPTLHDPASAKPVTAEEKQVGEIGPLWLKGVRQGYPLLRRAGRELAQEGEVFFDATGVFDGVEETLYVDNCHVNRMGNEILARAVAEAFLEALPGERQ